MQIKSNKEIPEEVLKAFEYLIQQRTIKITSPLSSNSDKKRSGWVFRCLAMAKHPSNNETPIAVPLRVEIPELFPLSTIEVFSEDQEIMSFPHQEAITGKLCLLPDYRAPQSSQKIACYLKWAEQWINDAINNRLIKPEDPYELPDFSKNRDAETNVLNKIVMFCESEESFKEWNQYIPSIGNVECISSNLIRGIIASKFTDNNGRIVWMPPFNSNILNSEFKIMGKWLIVPDIKFKRYRPPQTYGEIINLCANFNIDFSAILKEAFERISKELNVGIILVGFPIPHTFGGNSIEIHWQPLVFRNFRGIMEDQHHKKKSMRSDRFWKRMRYEGCFKDGAPLPWGISTNINNDRLYRRGSLSNHLRNSRIALFGCGALGSYLAELLTRGGVSKLSLFDSESLQPGNLCRHSLDGRSIGIGKAQALKDRLISTNPLCEIEGYTVTAPISSLWSESAEKSIYMADIFIDCTADDFVFRWLSQYSFDNKKPMISLYLNILSEFLTVIVSSNNTAAFTIYKDIESFSQDRKLPEAMKGYFQPHDANIEIYEGTGCWHPTFPGLNAHILMLLSTAIEVINSYSQDSKSEGLGLILNRGNYQRFKGDTKPLVEIAWEKQYP